MTKGASLAFLTAAATAGAIILAWPASTTSYETHPYYAIDGDTLSVGAGPHIRLARIDAPELPGHCRPDRDCMPGDPYAAKDALANLIAGKDICCEDSQNDVYGRRIAECYLADGTNISDAMVATGLVGMYHRSSK